MIEKGPLLIEKGPIMMDNVKKPPKHLSTEAKKIWKTVISEYGIVDIAGIKILKTALESFDRAQSAREQIEADGLTVLDRFGILKPHPLLPIERDSRSAFLAGLKALNLDIEPLKDRPGRPSGGR